MTTRTSRRDNPRTPDLSPEDSARRLWLIHEAQANPASRWSVLDVSLVADVKYQTVLVWAVRHPDFPGQTEAPPEAADGRMGWHPDSPGRPTWNRGRPLTWYSAKQMLAWLLVTERLIPGTWQAQTPGTGATGGASPNWRQTTPQQLPGVLRRAIQDVLGLARSDMVVRSVVAEEDGREYRDYTLRISGKNNAQRVVDNAAKVEAAAAAMGQPLRILPPPDPQYPTVLLVEPVPG